jgi:hypothetical protein
LHANQETISWKGLTLKRRVKETPFPSTFQRGKINKKSHLTQKKPSERGSHPYIAILKKEMTPTLLFSLSLSQIFTYNLIPLHFNAPHPPSKKKKIYTYTYVLIH